MTPEAPAEAPMQCPGGAGGTRPAHRRPSSRPGRSHKPLPRPCGRFYRGGMSGDGEIARNVQTARLEALEGPPLLLVELPAGDGGLDLLIYDERGALVDVTFVPVELVLPS
ncbi:hypothetical protein GCM10010304_82990 [Streptomyces roseoviolaceus]